MNDNILLGLRKFKSWWPWEWCQYLVHLSRHCTVLFDDCRLNPKKFFSSLLPQALCYCPFYTEELAVGGASCPVPFQAFYRSVIFYRSRWCIKKLTVGKNSDPVPYHAPWYCSVNFTNRGDLPKLELGRNFHPIASHASCYTLPLTLSAGCGVLNWKWGPGEELHMPSHASCYYSFNC